MKDIPISPNHSNGLSPTEYRPQFDGLGLDRLLSFPTIRLN